MKAGDPAENQVNDPILFFRRELITWWEQNGRDFPWRQTRDPYRVLIAELMLRRTRAEQVERVYIRFLERFPTISYLANADADEVARILYPLGLAWRVPAFQQVARAVVDVYGGHLPADRTALMELPGIGSYVADAILSFAFEVPVAVVDTNTVRVAGRYLGFSTNGEARRRRQVIDSIQALAGTEGTRELNLAMLDLAAMICRPGRPFCDQCPVASACSWRTAHSRAGEPALASLKRDEVRVELRSSRDPDSVA